MPKETTGYVGQDECGRWFYRFQFSDNGKRKQIRRICTSETNAKSELRKALNKHEQSNDARIHDGDKMKFAELAARYEKHKVFAAQYKANRKVAGLRSHKTVKTLLTVLVENFGAKLIKSIRPSDIESYKLKRLNTPTRDDKERAISSVNRELAIFRACLNFAVREGWLASNPFAKCSVISKADETKRERVLSHDEEQRLLAALDCHNKQNKQTIIHIKPLVIAAIDTGCRRGELFKLKWQDVDFESGLIHIRATNTKTQTARVVGLTDRLHKTLNELWKHSSQQLELSVFGYDGEYANINKAWKTACEKAGIEGLVFHSLRHTFATRITEAGTPMVLAMRLTGHQQPNTFLRYSQSTNDSAKKVAESLSNFNFQNSTR